MQFMQTSTSEKARYTIARDLHDLEIVDASYQKKTFSRHVHEGYCIGVIESGAQNFFAHGRKNTASRDCIILVNADQVHDGSCATEYGWSYQAMYPVPEIFNCVSHDLYNGKSNTPWFAKAVTTDRLLANQLRHLFRVIKTSENALSRETALINTLSLLIQRHARVRPENTSLKKNSPIINRICEYLQDNISENVSLNDISRMAELNPSYLTRLFKLHTGLPPHAWQTQQRIKKAIRQIQTGLALADIATDCGFTDQSHLNRHFKRAMGVTPGDYAESFRTPSQNNS